MEHIECRCADCLKAEQGKADRERRRQETYVASLKQIKMAAAMRNYPTRDEDIEQAAQIRTDLLMVLEDFGICAESIRDVIDLSNACLRLGDAKFRYEFALAAIVDGPYSMKAGLLTEATAARRARGD